MFLRVPDIIKYKLSKLNLSLLKDSSKLPEVLHELLIPTGTIRTRNTRKKQQVYRKREKNIWNSYPEYLSATETHS